MKGHGIIYTHVMSKAGFELVFDHWGTMCPLSKNFGGHFHFLGDRHINFYLTFSFFTFIQASRQKHFFT